jgi:trans-aconitate methyltransferase
MVAESGDSGPPNRTGAEVRRFFEERLEQFGHDPRALDWSPSSQALRFKVLSEVAALRGKRVADLGSGLGDLYAYLVAHVHDVEYVGYDFSEAMVREARAAHPHARFEVLDVLHAKLTESFDVVLSSGVHNLEVGTNDEDMETLLAACWRSAREAVAVNMLSLCAPEHTAGRHYYDPARILRLATDLGDYVVLRQDYLPHDFTIYLYRNPPIRPEPAR